MKRRRRPLPVRRMPPGAIEAECQRCGLPGDFYWRYGVVRHKWTEPCQLREVAAQDEPQEAEAA